MTRGRRELPACGSEFRSARALESSRTKAIRLQASGFGQGSGPTAELAEPFSVGLKPEARWPMARSRILHGSAPRSRRGVASRGCAGRRWRRAPSRASAIVRGASRARRARAHARAPARTRARTRARTGARTPRARTRARTLARAPGFARTQARGARARTAAARAGERGVRRRRSTARTRSGGSAGRRGQPDRKRKGRRTGRSPGGGRVEGRRCSRSAAALSMSPFERVSRRVNRSVSPPTPWNAFALKPSTRPSPRMRTCPDVSTSSKRSTTPCGRD